MNELEDPICIRCGQPLDENRWRATGICADCWTPEDQLPDDGPDGPGTAVEERAEREARIRDFADAHYPGCVSEEVITEITDKIERGFPLPGGACEQ